MILIDQHTKGIMEGCKQRAKEAGLSLSNETLEYIVTNKDLLELSPKIMIPTLYDYWIHQIEAYKSGRIYEVFPHNPYETVINTRPPISFYNDNNPDWLNVMIFYHVLAHIDFFQNNTFFRKTWDDDFCGQALSDKETIDRLRSEKGFLEVDYVIEFARSIDNLVGYYHWLNLEESEKSLKDKKLDFYFDNFLQSERFSKTEKTNLHTKEVERYNACLRESPTFASDIFFAKVAKKHPDFENTFRKFANEGNDKLSQVDIIQYLINNSPVLSKREAEWKKTVLEIIRRTSLYFQPQIRTKIANEGWASHWHEKLFLTDDRIKGNEIDFAKVNAFVTAMPKIGSNPYALGMRIFDFIDRRSKKGCFSWDFAKIESSKERDNYKKDSNGQSDFIFRVRENFCDYTLINNFIDQDFVDENRLFVTGIRPNPQKGVWEYYVKSRKAEDYKRMISESLYHPPKILVDIERTEKRGNLNIIHVFEGKPLVKKYIHPTLIYLSRLWGGEVILETSEPHQIFSVDDQEKRKGNKWRKILYKITANGKMAKREKEVFNEN